MGDYVKDNFFPFIIFLQNLYFEKWKENGLLAIVSLGVCLIMALVFNFILTIKFRKDIEREKEQLVAKDETYRGTEKVLLGEFQKVER